MHKISSFLSEEKKLKTKAVLLGTAWKPGIINRIILWSLLVIFGFVFIYPLIYMVSYAFMTPSDVVNPFVHFVPTSFFYFENFQTAFVVLDYFASLAGSLLLAVFSALLQCVAASLTGYGLARFKVPAKGIILALILVIFIIPPQATMIPQMLMYTDLGMDNVLAFFIPVLFGQGLKSSVFILIFYQFFSFLPSSVEDAAKIDGAGTLRIFLSIEAPLSGGAFVLTFLFSFVWYFNETTLTSLFLGSNFQTLPLALESFAQTYQKLGMGETGRTGKNINEAVYMAGTFLSVLPLLLIYFAAQKRFVESIDRAGITGE